MVRNIVRSDRQSAFEASRASSAPSKRPRSPSDHSSIEARSDAASNGLGLGFVARARAASKPRARGVDARERVLRTARRIVVCEVAANIVRVECVYDAARRDTPYRYENENERARSRFRARPGVGRTLEFFIETQHVLRCRHAPCIFTVATSRPNARVATRGARDDDAERFGARDRRAIPRARAACCERARSRAHRAPRVSKNIVTPRLCRKHTRGRSAATARVNEDGARGSDEEILRHARGGDRR